MKLSKVFSIVAVVAVLLVSMSNVALAINPSNIKGNTNAAGLTSVSNIGTKIIGFVQVAGSLLSVGVLVVLGVKYMMGSAEEKAEYKKTLIPYVVGAIIVFAASNIAGVVFTFAGNITA